VDPVRRDVLAMGAAATAVAATSRAFAQSSGAEATASFFEKDDIRIRYQEVGSGFPLLCIPGGGLNSRIAVWPTAVINAMDTFKNDFRCITMDQRNANGGESTGPISLDNPWDAFADDQLSLMDHLGIRQFAFFGNCIAGPFALKLMERAPDRLIAAVLSQPVGHRPEQPDVMYNSGRDIWATELRKRQPEVSMEFIEKYLHNLYRVRADFVYSVTREFIRSCQTPMLVLPDDIDAHPYKISVDIASLAPNAEITVYPWKDPPELKARTINRAITFLKAHQPVATAK
jgi:pimeloyl-ACP methyl ester carboxylesterase